MKFILLTSKDDLSKMLFNVADIISVYFEDDDESYQITLRDESRFDVVETPEEILKLIHG